MASPPSQGRIDQILREASKNGVLSTKNTRLDEGEAGNLLGRVPLTLTALDVSGTTFTDNLLAKLSETVSKLPNLKYLSLKSCGLGKLGGEGLRKLGDALKALGGFETLELGDNGLSQPPREILQACKGGIYLDNNPVGEFVADWSPHLQLTLSSVSLSKIGLNDQGLFALASCLLQMENLLLLNLNFNNLTDDCQSDLISLKQKGLTFNGNKRITRSLIHEDAAKVSPSSRAKQANQAKQPACVYKPRTSSVPPSAYRYDVVVSGGGPTGLMTAIGMAERSQGAVRVRVYGDRWVRCMDGKVNWRPEDKAGNRNRRRPQVVTIQDSALIQASDRTKEVLFRNHNETAWRNSKQIAIREVEDRLMELASEMGDVIELIPGKMDGDLLKELNRTDPFDLLVIAEGAGSSTKKLLEFEESSEQITDYALGVAFDFDRLGPDAPQPQAQPLNTAITISQTRYLLNSLGGRKGFLNIRLTESEYAESVDLDGRPCTFGHWGLVEVNGKLQGEGKQAPGSQFAPQKNNTALWRCIESGLRLFNIPMLAVEGVMRIPIEVVTSSKHVKQIQLEGVDMVARHRTSDNRSSPPFAVLVGDASFRVHFWPGRGLNSGFKGAIQLGMHLHTHIDKFAGKEMASPNISFFSSMSWCGWMSSLASNEQDARSTPMLKMVPVPLKKGDSQSYPPHHNKNGQPYVFEDRMRWTAEKKSLISEDLKLLAELFVWGARKKPIPEGDNADFWEELIFEKRLHRASIHEMVESGRWPLESMSRYEDEILNKEGKP